MHDSEVRLGSLKRLLVPYAVSGDLTMQRYDCALLVLVECILPTKLTANITEQSCPCFELLL